MFPVEQSNNYFNKHLFRAGLGCPVKLFYKAQCYPESKKALPFIAHNSLNKSQFKTLVRSLYPHGHHIESPTVSEASDSTSEVLHKNNATVFDAVFLWQDIMAKLPLIEKQGDRVTVLHIQTKAFNPGKHRLTNHHGQIYPKWKDYLTDFAFQLFIIRQLYPQWKITPLLVLPNKAQEAKVDQLYEEIKDGGNKAWSLAQANAEDVEELLVKVNVGDLIEKIWNGDAWERASFRGRPFGQVLDELKDLYFSGDKHPVKVGSHCKNCEFRIEDSEERNGFEECWEQVLENNAGTSSEMVFDLIGAGTDDWIDRELYLQHQVPSEEITTVEKIRNSNGRITERQRQALQILKAKGTNIPSEIIKPQLFKELRRWKYPIHFLDFEAGNYTIPLKAKRKPYHLVVFQYSCHTLHEDGSWKHHEWIDDLDNGYPNYEFIRQLRNIPRLEEGTVVQYSNFERNALKTVRKELIQEEDEMSDAGELIEWIDMFISRHDSNRKQGPYLADLSRLVKHYYYNSKMGNSLSIKDVVQSVLTESPYLKKMYQRPYSSSNFDSIVWWQPMKEQELVKNPYNVMLDQQNGNGVRRGTEAMVVYGRMLSDTLEKPDVDAHLQALLKYCELDTLAMLMIYQHWHELLVRT